ncbi:MAG: fasciclin domain-containing protein [Azospirillaceae bacterium]
MHALKSCLIAGSALALAACVGSSSGEMAASSEAMPTMDIVDTAIAAGDFDTLVTAVQAAGLVETLKGDGPFTVFAPTDAAFAALPPEMLNGLLAPENRDQLAAVLTYHVVPGAVMSGDLSGEMNVATVQGETVYIDARSGVTVNGANVVAADIETSNGVIHAIDAVILPPSMM